MQKVRGKLRFQSVLIVVAIAAVGCLSLWKVAASRPGIERQEERRLANNPAAQAAHRQGEAAYATGDLPNALRGFETAARLEPQSALARLNVSLVETRLGHGESALAAAKSAAELRPEWGLAWVRIAHLHADGNRLSDAASAAERATGVSPRSPDAWLAWGHVALLKGDLAASEGHARKAISLDSKSVPAWLALGECLLRAPGRERLDDAIQSLQRANGIQDTLFGRRLLGEALRRSGRHAEAIEALEAASKMDPRDATSAYQLSLALREAGKVSDADTWAERAKELEAQRYRLAEVTRKAEQQPRNLSLQIELAQELKLRGDRPGAMAAYQRVLALEPEHPAARKALAALEAGVEE